MEFVKLVSGKLGGNIFTDSKGRTLFDISNAAHYAGEYVATDGRYIYGWQRKDNILMLQWQPVGGYVYATSDGRVYSLDESLQKQHLCNAPKGSFLVLGTDSKGAKSYAFLCAGSVDGETLHYDVYNLLDTDKDGNPVLDGSFDIPGVMAMEIAMYIGGQSLFDDISFDACVSDDGKFQAISFEHGGTLYEWSGMFTWKASRYRLYPSGDLWKIRIHDDDGKELDMAVPSYVHITQDGAVHSIVTMGYIDKDWLRQNFLAVYPIARYGTGIFFADSVIGFFDNDTKGLQMARGREMWKVFGWKPTNIAIGMSNSLESYDISCDFEDWHVATSNAHHTRLGPDMNAWSWSAACTPLSDWKGGEEAGEAVTTNRITIQMPRETPLNVARKALPKGKRVCLTNKGIYVGGEKVVEDERMRSKRIEWMSQGAIARMKSSIMAISAKLGDGRQEEGDDGNG